MILNVQFIDDNGTLHEVGEDASGFSESDIAHLKKYGYVDEDPEEIKPKKAAPKKAAK